MPDIYFDKLSRAVMQTIAYSDIFDYPLTAREIHRYLTGVPASFEAVVRVLEDGVVLRTGEYFTLPGRAEISSIRIQREARSRELMPHAIRYGRLLGRLPYIRMVALTGSLAVSNISKAADFDYMLVAVPGRVWTARAFALAFNRVTRLFGHTLCPNLIVSENSLAWPLHDLYSARELCQMIPITGIRVYYDLMNANQWAGEFLPNAFMEHGSWTSPGRKRTPAIQNLFEFLLSGQFGDRFERWEMNRKIARFSKQAGFSDETVFNAEVCQGNFHHHRKWTQEVFHQRLSDLDADSPLHVGEGLVMRVL
jgi:hypothetical protein